MHTIFGVCEMDSVVYSKEYRSVQAGSCQIDPMAI